VECEKAVMFHVKPPDEPKKVGRDDEDYKALRADLETFKTQIAQAKEETRKVRIEAQRASSVAQTAPDQAAERRALARAALKGEE